MIKELALLDNFDKAKVLIAEADLVEAIDWINKGEALKVYATKAKKGLEIQNQCAEIKIRAERRAGEILAGMEKSKGGNPNLLQDATGLCPSYKDLGIERTQAMRWQTEALVPAEVFQKHVVEVKTAKQELTSAAVQKLGSQIAGKAKRQSERMAPKLKRLQELEKQGIHIGTLWNFGARANYAGDPNFHGNSPTQIVENSILLYTKESDVVLDPMAGSGTAIDVCNKLNRQCIATDIKSIREDIIECDARHLKNGTFEVLDESVDFIFLHPPYWKLITYTKQGERDGDLSQLEYQPFLDAMEGVFRECHRVLKDKKVLCLLIGDLVSEGTYKPIAIPLYNQATKFMTPIGVAVKTTQGSQSQVSKGKTVWAEVAMTQNLKIEHDFVMLFRKDGLQ